MALHPLDSKGVYRFQEFKAQIFYHSAWIDSYFWSNIEGVHSDLHGKHLANIEIQMPRCLDFTKSLVQTSTGSQWGSHMVTWLSSTCLFFCIACSYTTWDLRSIYQGAEIRHKLTCQNPTPKGPKGQKINQQICDLFSIFLLRSFKILTVWVLSIYKFYMYIEYWSAINQIWIFPHSPELPTRFQPNHHREQYSEQSPDGSHRYHEGPISPDESTNRGDPKKKTGMRGIDWNQWIGWLEKGIGKWKKNKDVFFEINDFGRKVSMESICHAWPIFCQLLRMSNVYLRSKIHWMVQYGSTAFQWRKFWWNWRNSSMS